jgi:ABC-type multidrug transport system permease subunit
MFLSTLSNILGAIILISIILPWFLIAVVIVSILYAMAAAFYRASAREMKVRALLRYRSQFAE